MSGMMMGTSTAMSMPMPSGTTMGGGSNSSAMPMSTNMVMGMDTMAMTFFTSSATPLFSLSWTPDTTGQYVGTCIFLIVFAAIFRALLALRIQFYPLLAAVDTHRNGGLAYKSYENGRSRRHRWRAREAVLLGVLDVIIAAVGYLLMIAVMTMNIGYFLSVLAGVFVGSVAFGRFILSSAAH